MIERIAWFKDLNKESLPVAGGKGANLGEMFNLGLPIPPGFAISAQTYKEFIEETDIKEKISEILKTIDIENTEQLQTKANDIQKLIVSIPVPETIKEDILDAYDVMSAEKSDKPEDLVREKQKTLVAVRSSATAEDLPEASFAGQQATFLNIKGNEDLIKAVRGCWASLFTARAIYYREKNNFSHDQVLISVIVQKMINSDKSGVMFSANPTTNNLNEIVIEGAFGLGEAIVSGAVNPDMYVLDKNTLDITKTEVKEQKIKIVRDPKTGKTVEKPLTGREEKLRVLNDIEIKQLAVYAKKIEKHYGKPQDIEWAIENNEMFILQSRAITTIKERLKEKKTDETDKEVLIKGEIASPGIAFGTVKLIQDLSELNKIKKGDILVTTMTTPDMVPAMQKAGAIVTNEGGITCHAAIVSREMGIPCIVGTRNATEILKEGDEVTVHATQGVVYKGNVVKKSIEITEEKYQAMSVPIITATKIKVMVDLPDYAEKAAATDADGVGLVRLEMMIAQAGELPANYIKTGRKEEYIQMLMNGLQKIAIAFKDKPVWVRTSDIRTDEYKNLKGGENEPHESNPMMGWHAIRRALDVPDILKAEFEAIKRLHEQGLTNIGVMIPFVIRAREVRTAKAMMKEVGLEPCRDIRFGVMIETPASCFIIKELCEEGIDFISFGTNDLTQLTLGIDRNNEIVAKLYDEMHPAVLREIAAVIKVCKKYHVETSICGQAGSREDMAAFLVKHGIDSISANRDAVQNIRETVARAEKKLMLDAEREELEKKEQ